MPFGKSLGDAVEMHRHPIAFAGFEWLGKQGMIFYPMKQFT